MATSGTYNFQNQFTTDVIIKEAFERCGKLSDIVTANESQSAMRSLNIMFSNWLNRGLNLWAVDQQMIQLVPTQATYSFPVGTVDIINDECKLASITRQLNGTAYSNAGGVAANAFDGDPTTACTQTSPNGYISYDYGTGVAFPILYVGITSFVTNTYSLAVEYSNDNATWYNAFTGFDSSIDSNTTQPINYIAGQIIWLVPSLSILARYWRIRETGGATLNIAEIYFCIPNFSKIITRLSREEYISISQLTLLSDVSAFIVNRQVTPTITFWPTPSLTTQYTVAIFNRKRMFQDVADFVSNVDTPQRFFEALASGLAASLAQKFAPEKYDSLKAQADSAFTSAASNDTESVPLRLQPDFSSYYGR
jgi:hypothetical protein